MAKEGGFSDPRNATLMKMFGMIGIGERAGSGIPTILETWTAATQQTPSYEISYSPDRVTCVIQLGKVNAEETENHTEDYTEGLQKATEKILSAIRTNSHITIKSYPIC